MEDKYQFFRKFNQRIPLSAKKWNEYTHWFKQMRVPAKTILIGEGDVSKKLFIIEQGCIRAWFNNNGKDVTFQFFFENNIVSSIESFRKKVPSLVSIETVEPSIVWWIHKTDMDKILSEVQRSAELREMLINALFERTFNYMKHFFSSIRDTPERRYLNLMEERPQIIQRVPQHYIASYLGISSVHLSRIKSKLAKKKASRGI